jgi:hypothetical protein
MVLHYQTMVFESKILATCDHACWHAALFISVAS